MRISAGTATVSVLSKPETQVRKSWYLKADISTSLRSTLIKHSAVAYVRAILRSEMGLSSKLAQITEPT